MILGLNSLIPSARADSNDIIYKINQFVEEQREISQIPGISVVIVEKGETVYQQGFGYADVKEKIPVNSRTLFELASTSKAYTGLAILQLENEGLLKRTDDVRKFIPWLELEYEGEPQTITIEQLLHQTSGIASNTIVRIPESNAENALELTVRTLLDQPLNHQPGSAFEYATINYDVLGLVIQNVSKQPYDVYIKEQLLEPIGMNDSYAGLHQVQSDELAKGYKIGFMSVQEYTPPIYRGNIPAGYLVSNANDIAKWLNLQLGAIQNDTISKEIIEQSHIPDQSGGPILQDTYYASGWSVEEKDEKRYIWHDGANPTFSAYFIMQPAKQIGVAILSNMDTTFTTEIGKGVMDLWEGNNVSLNYTDGYQKMDKIVTVLSILVGCLGTTLSILLLRNIWKLKRKQRVWASMKGKRIFLVAFHSLFTAVIFLFVMAAPKMLNMTWTFIRVWAPTSVTALYYIGIVTLFVYYFYLLGLMATTKKN